MGSQTKLEKSLDRARFIYVVITRSSRDVESYKIRPDNVTIWELSGQSYLYLKLYEYRPQEDQHLSQLWQADARR